MPAKNRKTQNSKRRTIASAAFSNRSVTNMARIPSDEYTTKQPVKDKAPHSASKTKKTPKRLLENVAASQKALSNIRVATSNNLKQMVNEGSTERIRIAQMVLENGNQGAKEVMELVGVAASQKALSEIRVATSNNLKQMVNERSTEHIRIAQMVLENGNQGAKEVMELVGSLHRKRC